MKHLAIFTSAALLAAGAHVPGKAAATTWTVEASGEISQMLGTIGDLPDLPFDVGSAVQVRFTLDDRVTPDRTTTFGTTAGTNILFGDTISDLSTDWGSYTARSRTPLQPDAFRFDYTQIHNDYVPRFLPDRAPSDGTIISHWVSGDDLAPGFSLERFSLSMFGAPADLHDDGLPSGDKFRPEVLAAAPDPFMLLVFDAPDRPGVDFDFKGNVKARLDRIAVTRNDDPAVVPLPPAMALLLAGLSALLPVARRRSRGM